MNRRKYDFMCFLIVLILGILLLVPVSVGATGKYVVTSVAFVNIRQVQNGVLLVIE